MDHVVVAGEKDAELVGGEEVLATVEDLVEYGRSVGDGAADHLQHLGGGSLLLTRLLQFAGESAYLIL